VLMMLVRIAGIVGVQLALLFRFFLARPHAVSGVAGSLRSTGPCRT
jgi:hypothetical protein